MKTTIEVEDALGRQLQDLATFEGTTLESILQRAVRDWASHLSAPTQRRELIKLPVVGDSSNPMSEEQFRRLLEEAEEADDARRMWGQ